ncbi:MAG: efflux transporter outer membrane subunit [Burkholderiales bacterium]|nr:efflux transporter outer membrane subunit [Burkholderiales bacterium]
MSMRSAVLALTLALGGCMLGPDYQRADIRLPENYPESGAGGATAQGVQADWWTLYRDPLLDRLVKAGLENGTDMRIAVARIEEARAVVREADATLLPELEANVAGSRARSSTRTGTLAAGVPAVRSNFIASAGTAFELDFWGRLRRLQEAARAQYIGSRYGHDVVALGMASSIVQGYFTIRALDAQIIVSAETLRAAADSADIARQRAQAGIASDLDLFQAEGSRLQFSTQLKELQRLRAVAVHQLGVLVADPSLAIAAGDLRLPAPPLPPAGLPSALLERRPDVRQAEAAAMSANAQIGIARAAQFPAISLTASAGSQSAELSNLFSSGARIWSIGLGAVGPILDWGRYAARTEQAEARARQSALAHEQAVRTAFREVSDALSNVRIANEADADYRNRVDQAQNALRLATQRYESGYSAYLEVLDAQRTLNAAQLAFVLNRRAYLGYTVDLMIALGGGWQPY